MNDLVEVAICASLSQNSSHWPKALALLDATERDHLRRLRDPHRRCEYATGHAVLRQLAARWTGIPPESVRFTRRCSSCGGPHGKPEVIDALGTEVNLSHAGGYVMAAATASGPVGVDIEQVKQTDFPEFDRTALNDQERALVAAAPPHQRPTLRTRLWTAKESVLKAIGEGLATPASEVAINSFNASNVTHHDALTGRDRDIALRRVRVLPGYEACIAVITRQSPAIIDVTGTLGSSPLMPRRRVVHPQR